MLPDGQAALAGEFGEQRLLVFPGDEDQAQVALLAHQPLISSARGVRGVVNSVRVRVDEQWGRRVSVSDSCDPVRHHLVGRCLTGTDDTSDPLPA
ncbi:hypothetical protein ABZ402_46095 [Streptomyces mirabilis]|uniref:hypothetical protein n=1 Tax=Streptomyces mirabilis TaxID=68239 RepID=UPI0033E21D65